MSTLRKAIIQKCAWALLSACGIRRRPMARYKLICTNAAKEEIFTVEGYETEAEAQAMLNALLAVEGPLGHTWTLEPERYN